MKKNLLILSLAITAISFQLKATEKPNPKNESPLFLKKKESKVLTKDGDVLGSSKNIVKINLTQLALTNISLQYERGFHKNLSFALGASLLIPRDIPSQIFEPSSNAEGYQLPKFGGWSITPELRFYPGKKEKHQAPHGFYLAPYFRYSNYSLNANYLDSVNVTTTRTYNVKANYAGFTGGLMIGSQWLIGKHFSIDWWILGGGAGKAKFTIDSKSVDNSLNMTDQEQQDLKNDINDNINELGSFGKGSVAISTTPNSASVVIKGLPMTSIRGFGLVLGFTF